MPLAQSHSRDSTLGRLPQISAPTSIINRPRSRPLKAVDREE
jgi:hypothetical protein